MFQGGVCDKTMSKTLRVTNQNSQGHVIIPYLLAALADGLQTALSVASVSAHYTRNTRISPKIESHRKVTQCRKQLLS